MQIPIFPLNGAILLRNTNLPLNIFEERYLEMVDYSLANQRLLGMIQMNSKNELYNTGCLGKIVNFSETNDNRYLISLEGIDYYKIDHEIDTGYKFKMVEINLLKYDENAKSIPEKEKYFLINKFKEYVSSKNIRIDTNDLESIDVNEVIKFIAMVSPFSIIDKQTLIETSSLSGLHKKLLSILELEIYSTNSKPSIN